MSHDTGLVGQPGSHNGKPDLRIGVLAFAATGLLEKAINLPDPEYISISDAQTICFQFAGSPAGAAAVVQWACLFGGVLADQLWTEQGTVRCARSLEFDHHGVQVVAYAFIPAPEATT